MKKKILALALCVAMLAISVVSGTLAYFTDSAIRENVITVGTVSAELYESEYHRGASANSYLTITGQPSPTTPDDIKASDAKYNDVYLAGVRLMPFDLKSTHRVQSMFEECTVAKNAYVENTGSNTDAFVRVRYSIPAKIAQYLDIFYTDTQFIAADSEIATADARTLDNTDKNEPMITAMTSNGANFVAQGAKLSEDGKYYYADFIYAERLTPGEMTEYSPISKITLIPSVTEDTIAALNLTARQFDIQVEAHVIQADGFYNAIEAFAAYDGNVVIK